VVHFQPLPGTAIRELCRLRSVGRSRPAAGGMATAITLFQSAAAEPGQPSRIAIGPGAISPNGAQALMGAQIDGGADGSRERCRCFASTTFTAIAGP